jgi:hypothetical protein
MITKTMFDADKGKLLLTFLSFSGTSLLTLFCRLSFALLSELKDLLKPKTRADIMIALATVMPIGTKRYESIK